MQIQVREFATGKVVKEFTCTCSEDSHRHEKMMLGLLRNMDTDRFCVDEIEDKEVADANTG